MSALLSQNQVESVLKSFDSCSPAQDLNGIIKYYIIIDLFDKTAKQIPKEDRKNLKYYKTIIKFRELVGRFFSRIKGEELASLFSELNINYRDTFIEALVRFKVISRISAFEFSMFLNEHPCVLSSIIHERKMVDLYEDVILTFLLTHIECAESVVNHFFEKHECDDKKTFMPKGLRQVEINTILRNYVDSKQASINYLELIAGLKKSGKYPVDERIRFKAWERYKLFWATHPRVDSLSPLFCSKVCFCNQTDEVVENYYSDSRTVEYCYSNNWISENLDYNTLLNNFIFLFQFVDKNGRCKYLSNPHQLGIFEQFLGLHPCREYPTGISYETHDERSTTQMKLYKDILKSHNIEIEALFKWFFEQYLCIEFGVKGFHYHTPSSSASYLERILLMASQLDAVLKQFRLYLEDGIINRELFEFSSMPYKIVETPSMIGKKYLYPQSEVLKKDLLFLFTNHILVTSNDKVRGIETFFADYIRQNNVRITDYSTAEQQSIERLINRKNLYVDENGFLKIQRIRRDTLYDLYYNGNIVYPYCTSLKKEIVDSLLEENELIVESTLFTRQEQEYIDFMLNVQKFNNGPELRNKYVHGSFSLEQKTHEQDYNELLKIMILIIIKINEEFCLKYPVTEISDTKL